MNFPVEILPYNIRFPNNEYSAFWKLNDIAQKQYFNNSWIEIIKNDTQDPIVIIHHKLYGGMYNGEQAGPALAGFAAGTIIGGAVVAYAGAGRLADIAQQIAAASANLAVAAANLARAAADVAAIAVHLAPLMQQQPQPPQ